MKIAMFAWEALEGLSVGGGAVYASRLAAALARAGHQVRLFTRQGPGQAMDEAVGGVMVRRCPWDRKQTFFEEIGALSQTFDRYFADALETDGPYDVIHCHEWFTIGAGLMALKRCPARFAVSFHSTEWGRTLRWPDSGDSARIAAVEREGIDRADAVICASHWVRRTIHEQFHPPDWKCSVVYHGADIPKRVPSQETIASIRHAAGMDDGSPGFLFAGRFSLAGGGDLAARAARIVSGRYPGARFLFVGAGPLEDDMRRNAGPAALFLPPQGRVVPPEYYHAVDLVLAPFRRDHNGRAVLPAWAATKPAVVMQNTVASEFVIHNVNGWVVEPDAVELAAVVMHAIDNHSETVWMGHNGRTAAETAFTWDKDAERLVAAYNRRAALTPPAGLPPPVAHG